MVIYKKIHFALFLVVIIMQFEAMCSKFLSNHGLIHCTKIDALDVLQNSIHIQSIQKICQQTHVIEIELNQLLLLRLSKRKTRIADSRHFQSDTRVG